MGAGPRQEFTLILGRARAGDEWSTGELITQVYDELRRVASRLVRRERTDHTLRFHSSWGNPCTVCSNRC
jgi:ECF sigma factor